MTLLTLTAPYHAAPLRKARSDMDIILHLGAHRTASTSFQHYMRRNAVQLRSQGTAFWGPNETRNGLLSGAIQVPGRITAPDQMQRARGRVALKLSRLKRAGVTRLIVSDENLIGSPRQNLRNMRLYAAVGERMARYHAALGGNIAKVVFGIRAQEAYWASALAFTLERGGAVPSPAELRHMAHSPRSWRDVITDLACAMPGTQIAVLPHERYASLPEAKLAVMTGQSNPPRRNAREWLNRRPPITALRRVLHDRGEDPDQLAYQGGDWHPFDDAQRAALHEAYMDDLFWLRAGADGLAYLTDETAMPGTGLTPSAIATTKGQRDDIQERRMA